MPHKKHNSGGNNPPAPVQNDIVANEVFNNERFENNNPNVQCCVPTTCAVNTKIDPNVLTGLVKVMCNNESCKMGQYMHQACFENWEESVLAYLRSCGRARSWSEKQRHQNLWTKKGYDLAYKACACKCSKGHLRKDLNWIPPKPEQNDGEVNTKKKKRRNKSNQKPALRSSQPSQQNAAVRTESQPIRTRTNSFGSSESASSSPPCSTSPPSPVHPTPNGIVRRKDSFFSDRSRHGSGNGIFPRRMDFSSFNILPKQKINSFHIKMEDEGYHGNDETRCFILSSMATSRQARTSCILCQTILIVYDRYPLIDGAFFLSPRQHSKSSIQVKTEGRSQFLCAVCMGCLEGWSAAVCCRYCTRPWEGNQLILGTMYFYDIFAAMPCCSDRLKCNNCHHILLPPERAQTFSAYSHASRCPHCGVTDFHFVKSLSTYQLQNTFTSPH